jgi:hypothetical protein
MQMDTTYTPRLPGSGQAGGLWTNWAARVRAGENIIIGMVDGGIWPENPSLCRPRRRQRQAEPQRHPGYGAPPASWKGTADRRRLHRRQLQQQADRRAYFDKQPAQYVLHWTEFRSAARFDRRQRAMAATVPTPPARPAATPAPKRSSAASTWARSRAWRRARASPCTRCAGPTPPIHRRQERLRHRRTAWRRSKQAVKDGVNVINFSIGPAGGVLHRSDRAGLPGRSNAGVFVAASAGNGGPGRTPVAHISPWLTTVGNSTHNRELFSPMPSWAAAAKFTGASMNAALPAAPLILPNAGLAGADATNINAVRSCFGQPMECRRLLDPAKVNGKILVCDRGTNVLVNKSANGQGSRRVGVIIANVVGLVADHHQPRTRVDRARERCQRRPHQGYTPPASADRVADHAFVTGSSRCRRRSCRVLVARTERGQQPTAETGPGRAWRRHPRRRDRPT